LDPLLGWRPDVLATAPDGGQKTKKKIRKVMSNNISRKGLAWGALVAIAASLFATAPAHAAAGITLAANSTSQVMSVPTGTPFQLVETASSDIPSSSWNMLAYSVASSDAGAAIVTVDGRSQKVLATSDARVIFTQEVRNSANNQTIEVRSTSATTKHFVVTAWLDANDNGVVDTGEYSATQTVTFLGAADLTAVTSFVKSPTYTNDARKSLDVRTELTNVNNDQMKLASVGATGNAVAAAAISIDLRSGTYDARSASTTARGASVFVSGDARFYAGDGNPATVMGVTVSAADINVWHSGAIFTAQAYWLDTKIGSAVSTTTGLVNNNATSIAIDTVKGANAALKDVNNSASVRTSSAFQISATVRGDAGALAGQAVKFGVDSSSAQWVTGTIRVTVSGTGVASATYSTSADFRAATWTVTSDSNGNALLNVTVEGMKANDPAATNIIFTATSANLGTVNLTVQQTDATASALAITPASQAVVLGKAASVAATLKDQFGQLVTTGNYVAQVKYYDGPGTSASESFSAFTNGAATVAITVDGTVTGSSRYTVQARKVLADGSYDSVIASKTALIVTRAAADLVAGYIKIQGSTETLGIRTAAARVSVDTKALAGATASALTAVAQSVMGRVVITGDRGVPYAVVTLTGANLFFVNSADGFDAGTTTVTADVDGYFTATVRSNTSGTASVTATIGSAAAQTTTWTVDAPGQYAGVSVVSASPSYVALVGNEGLVTFSARDVFGNQLTAASLTARGDDGSYFTALDAKGYLNITNNARTTAGSTTYTYTYSNDARLYTGTVRVDWAKATVTVTLPDTITAGQNADVVVTVTDPAGNALSGKSVSATSTGVGYLTVSSGTTDSNGQATLKLYANENELGWAYVTATSTPAGNVASTSDATGVQVVAPDAIPTATDSVAAIALEVPATAQAGTVVDVVATATDADGNPVSGAVVSATSTGVGYLAIAGGTTDDNGQVVLKLVIGAGDNGAASVVANSGSAQSDAAQVTAGATDANITLNKKRVTVDWSFAANKKVVIVRDGVAIKSFTASSNAADSFSFNLKKGTHKVSVKVGGVTLDSQSYKIAK